MVRDEAERLNIDIQNLLDATTISRQQVRPKLQWVEPVDIVNAAFEHRRRRLSGYPVTFDLHSNLPIVHVDPAQVEQALVQIIDNAAKYSPAGSPIRVAAHPNGQTVMLSVHDSGSGLTTEEKRQVGGRFFRGPRHKVTTSGSGSDCGSPMPSSPPTAARSRSKATAPTAAPRSPSICRCRPRPNNWRRLSMSETPASVLVVDDEIQIRRFLRTGFELDGFMVHEAETGAEALRAATLQPSDLVILDLGLPDMDGADVLERLRSWSSVPLIVLSVRGSENEKVRLLEAGADDYVVKPFGMAELLARAHSAMRRQLRASRGEPVMKFGPLSIDFAARAVFINDRARHADARRNTGCCRFSPSTPAMWSPTSSCCARSGATSTSTTPITCAFSCASCGARSRPTRPSRASCSPSLASATAWFRPTDRLRPNRPRPARNKHPCPPLRPAGAEWQSPTVPQIRLKN